MTAKKQHRTGINEANLVHRHLRLVGLDSGKAELIVSTIDKIAGIDRVSINEDRCVLDVSYDAAYVNISQIEDIIEQYQCNISHDWWTQFKEGWYKFVDSNVKSNAAYHPSCCNKPPKPK